MKRLFRHLACAAVMTASLTATLTAWGQPGKSLGAAPGPQTATAPRSEPAGRAEARLIEIYQLISTGQTRQALDKAQALAADLPDFHLAHLVYGDLLASRIRAVRQPGDVPEALRQAGAATLNELKEESLIRLKALRERPLAGTLPSQFLALSPRSRHAIAVDASRSRLYLFENRPEGLTLVSDFYISVGKSGTEKTTEGDLRTPLGVYYITSHLDRRTLADFYGSGALPINYPNMLDTRRGKTGKGIWLHGTPPGQFSRPPKATDGCVVLANPDLVKIIQTVAVGSTPVVIAERLQWVTAQAARAQGQAFEGTLAQWQNAKSGAQLERLMDFYSPDFNSYGKTLAQWVPVLRSDMTRAKGRTVELKDVSLLHWSDSADTMVVTFGEVVQGTLTGSTRRQYWTRQGKQWKIFFEGVIG